MDNLNNFENLGLKFYKTIELKNKYKINKINVYQVEDYDIFYHEALFNGWFLTMDRKYSCNSSEIPPYSWLSIDTILSTC